MSTETPRDDRGEIWRQAMQQVPQPCACRFEWRPTPDFSGEPPKQLDECGFHATARTAAQSTIAEQAKEIERLTATIAAKDEAIKRLNGWLDNDRRALGEEG